LSKVKQIIELMQPFVDEGRLLERSYESINNELENFMFIENNGEIIACAALRLYKKENMGEIYGLVVNKDFHNTETSSNLMDLLIKKALDLNLSSIFALSKFGGRFFFRHDFIQSELTFLPLIRQKSYDYQRNSIIYLRNF